MDINSPLTPGQQPSNPNPAPQMPPRQFVATAPTPPPMRNPMTAPAPVAPQPVSVPPVAPAPQPVSQPALQPVVQTPTPLAMPEPMVQMSAPTVPAQAVAPIPTPVVTAPAPVVPVPTPVAPVTPQSIPVVPPMRVSEPAAGEVFASLNTPYVEPPLTPLSSMRSVPPIGGAVAVAPVVRKSHWFRTLVILIVLVLGASAAYVFGYDKTVLLSSKDLLAQSLISNTDIPQGSGQIKMNVTATSEIASDPMPVGEADHSSPTVGKTEPVTFDFSVNANFGFNTADGAVESYVQFDPLSLHIKPEYVAQAQGIPATIDAAFEVRTVDGVLYAQISRLTLEIAGMIELMTGVDVIGQWVSTAAYSSTTVPIESKEDTQRIGIRILNEAVTVQSDVYRIGSREVTFTIDPEKVVHVMADEQGIDEGIKKEAIEDLENIEFKKPVQFVIVVDRTGKITEATFSASVAESQTSTTLDVMFSYLITSADGVSIEAPSKSLDLDELFSQQFIETTEQAQAENLFVTKFLQMISTDNVDAVSTYAGACKRLVEENSIVDGVLPNSLDSEFPIGHEIKDVRCFDTATTMAVSAALYKDGDVLIQYCYDAATGAFTSDFNPVADPVSVSCIATIR